MIKTLILSHGPLAAELQRSAETIAGRNPHLESLALGWDDSFSEAREKTAAAIERLAPEDGLLILTDIHGGTPHNVATSFRRPGEVEVIAGVNLPMVVRLGCHLQERRAVDELAEWLEGKGKGSICRGRAEAAVAAHAAAPCAEE
jgi:mannose/fructose-specific phosphotransferase system component IIA